MNKPARITANRPPLTHQQNRLLSCVVNLADCSVCPHRTVHLCPTAGTESGELRENDDILDQLWRSENDRSLQLWLGGKTPFERLSQDNSATRGYPGLSETEQRRSAGT